MISSLLFTHIKIINVTEIIITHPSSEETVTNPGLTLTTNDLVNQTTQISTTEKSETNVAAIVGGVID